MAGTVDVHRALLLMRCNDRSLPLSLTSILYTVCLKEMKRESVCGQCVTSFSVRLPLIQSFDDVAIFDRLLAPVHRS